MRMECLRFLRKLKSICLFCKVGMANLVILLEKINVRDAALGTLVKNAVSGIRTICMKKYGFVKMEKWS